MSAGDVRGRRAGLRRARLIARREFFERVGQRAYLLAVVVGSLVAIAAVIAPALLDSDDDAQQDPDQVAVAIESAAPGLPRLALDDLQRAGATLRGVPIQFVPKPDASSVRRGVEDGDDAVGIVVAGPATAPTVRVITREDGGGFVADQAAEAVDAAAEQARAERLDDVDPADLLRPVEVRAETVSGTGPTAAATAVVSILGLLVYIGGILLTQTYATGIVTDRTGHVTERLLTAARPAEHLAGKLVGVGAAGLLQFFAWILVALAADVVAGGGTAIDRSPPALIAFFPVALVLTYVLYAASASVLVLPVRKSEDVSGAVGPAVMLQVIAFIATTTIVAPGATVSKTIEWLSLVPFFSPLLMLGRLAGGDVPTWQLVVAIAGPLVLAAILLRIAAPAYARYAIEAPGGKGLGAVLALLRSR